MPSLTGVWRLLSGNSSTSSSPPAPSASRTANHARTAADPEHSSGLALLTLGAIGVVYGDIGTSPLYALRECFHGEHGVAPTPDNVLGVLSLIFWSLTLIISIKYLLFVMRADNHGEGGILALLALVAQSPRPSAKPREPDRARALRRGAALRRRHDHARHLGAGRRRGTRRRNPHLRAVYRADHAGRS